MGGGSAETPKLYYVIYEQPLTSIKTCTMVIVLVMRIVMKNLLEKSTAPPLFSHHTLLGCTLLGPPDQNHGDEVDEVNELNLIFADYTLY